jgi:3-hydroxyacyl-CoA dehydrogenase/enoyl-CoA hydratase/3-hydroxybutyryl-CoA epimerase/enoyl-CoA isomerase
VFQGQSLRVIALEQTGLFELCFDRSGDPIDRFDEQTVTELRAATRLLAEQPGLRGVLVTSAKDVFIVGADITEFSKKFDQAAAAIAADVASSNDVFVASRTCRCRRWWRSTVLRSVAGWNSP